MLVHCWSFSVAIVQGVYGLTWNGIVGKNFTKCDRSCEKGPLKGNVNMVGMGENTREVDISRNHRLLHHWNLQCILYLQTEFETHTAFLRLK